MFGMMKITHGSLFSGIGGFDLASEWMGWDNLFHCEWNEFGQKVLKHYWPSAESFNDITKTDFTKYANKIDILTGGFPCQPYSTAGKRLGKEDDRHLWPEMLRVIREVRPRWVVGENVRGLVNWSGGLVFDEVQADLEAEGYEVLPFILPACAVNAPHRRDRVWFVAYSNSPGVSGQSANANTSQEVRQGRANTSETWDNGFTSRWDKFPTEPPICGGDDGLPTELDGITFSKWRNESIKAYGNAIVPQVAYEIFKVINEMDKSFFLKT
jgi:DNA (cytosine-5)-methyltransferase 1